VIYQPLDRAIYADLISSLRKKLKRKRSFGELMLDVGRYFLGFPYACKTLERRGRETLVINLREFDCFTLVENCVALAGVVQEEKAHFGDYTSQLKRIRYRHGISSGYSSRLHYFSDWLYDNEQKGILKNVTRRSGGELFRMNFNFMTRHRGEYPALSGEKSYHEMMAIEKRLSGRMLYRIPKTASGKLKGKVENGDLIAVTADIEGLDVIHVGLAIHLRGGIHILHASEVERKVVISDVTLHQYLSRRKTMTGIIIGRTMPAYQNDGSPSSA